MYRQSASFSGLILLKSHCKYTKYFVIPNIFSTFVSDNGDFSQIHVEEHQIDRYYPDKEMKICNKR